MGTKREPEADVHAAGPSGEPRQKSAKMATRAGTVVKVIVHNFMTYSKCEINPGDRLNLVLGPNGTGKSSFVCALCVGLGGSTKLLGRADSVKQFIRHGQTEGSTEVWLARDNGKIVKIYRKIKDDGSPSGKSEWKINGKPSTSTKVKELVAEYNVQLGNLCQFLPQDKVVEFAKLKPHELLIETEKALGDSHLYNMHLKLIEVREGLKTHESTLKSYEVKLGNLREKNSGLERDVERFQKRQELLDKVALRNQKKPWLEYSNSRQKLAALKTTQKDLEARHKAAEAELKQAEAPLRAAQARTKKCGEDKKKYSREGAAQDAKRVEMEDAINAETDKLDELHEQLDALEEESEKRLEKIARCQQQVAAKEAEVERLLQELSSQASDQAAEDTIIAERTKLDEHRRMLNNEVRELKSEMVVPRTRMEQCKAKIKKLEDHKRQRIDKLERRYKGITKVWEWVRNNPNAFRGKVVGPVATEVSTRDPTMAGYLEMQVPLKTWSSFLTEFPEDQKLLLDTIPKVTGLKKHNLVVTNYAADPNAPLRHPNGRAADYAEHGITATLDMALKDTPAIVAHVLEDEGAITRAFVGSSKLKDSYQAFLDQNTNITTLYLPDSRISVFGSRYNAAAKSKELVNTRRAELLAGGVDASQKERLERDLQDAQERLYELEAEVKEKEAEERQAEKLHKAKDDELRKLQSERKRIQAAKQKAKMNLTLAKKNLQSANKMPEPKLKEPKLRKELTKHHANIEAKILEFRDVILAITHALQRAAAADLAVEEAKIAESAAAAANAAKHEEVRDLRTRAEDAKHNYHEAKEETKRLQAVAQREAPQPEDPDERAAHQQKLSELTDDIDELVAEIETMSAEADTIICSNPQVMEQYKRRLAEIEELEGKVQSERTVVNNGNAKIDDIKGKWLPELEGLVEKINESFRVNFAEIGCAGEVKLHIDDDFDKCEIQIRVKFRDEEELQVLTASRQSGGERSVCTILYLIALQGYTDCPFRVVDEINQGMDPNNERKVFNQLVQCACLPGTPQTFLMTPKLLPDLPFTEDVRVLNIFNGPWVNDVARTFTVEDLLPAVPA